MQRRHHLTGIIIICVLALLLDCGLLVYSGFSPVREEQESASQNVPGNAGNRAVEIDDTDNGVAATGIEPLIKREIRNILFVGNSMMYYNNTPEMLCSMVRAGTKYGVDSTVLVFSGRTLKEHAKAIAAVLRTHGESGQLTKKEKKLFHLYRKTEYSQMIYDGYAERVWDKDKNQPKHFDAVVLQSYYKNGRGDTKGPEIAEAIMKIVNAFDSADTTYVVNAATSSGNQSLPEFIRTQDRIDKAVRNGVTQAMEQAGGKCQSVRFALYGRSFCNYLVRYGEAYAQNTEPKAYAVYAKRETSKGIVNDLIYGDGVHPTQLGSYIAAATIYSALYGDPMKTVEAYKASMHEFITRVDGRRIGKAGNFAAAYRKGKGFKSKKLLRIAADIAWKTQNEELCLQLIEV